jgi:WD40 repeat protein
VATASRDGAEQIWDARSGALQHQFNALRGKILSIEFDSSSRLVVAAGASGAVVVADAAQEMPVVVLDGPQGAVMSAHFAPDSRRVVGASWDGTARVWSSTSPYHSWSSSRVSEDCGYVTSLEPDQRFLAVGCRDRATRIWDTAHDQLLAELPSVTQVDGDFSSAFPAVSSTGDRAAIARGNTVEIYEVPGGQLLRAIRHSAAVNTVAFAPAGHDVISGATDGSLLVTRDGREPIALQASSGGIDAAALLSDGRAVVVDARDRLRICDPNRGIVLADLPVPNRMRMLRPSPDNSRLVVIPRYTGPAGLWDLEQYRPVAQLEGHAEGVYSARFVANGQAIVTAGADGAVRIWDGQTGHLRQVFRGGTRFLADATVTPDGLMVVAGGGDGLLRIWEASSQRLLWTLPAHKPHVVGIHFEGNSIVTRGFAGDVSRWTLPPSAQVIEAALPR